MEHEISIAALVLLCLSAMGTIIMFLSGLLLNSFRADITRIEKKTDALKESYDDLSSLVRRRKHPRV